VLARPNLTAVLAALAVLDLGLDRIVGRLFLPSPAVATASGRMLAQMGAFVSYLTGSLALLLFATGVFGLLRRRELVPRSMRFVVAVLAVFFVASLAISLSLFLMPQRLFIQIKTSHAFLSWLLVVALWRIAIPARVKLGVTLFALPAILHTAALFAAEMGFSRVDLRPADLARAGQILALAAAGAAPVLLSGRVRAAGQRTLVWLAGLVAVTTFAAVTLVKFDFLQLLALYGLRLDVPALSAPSAWAYVLLLGLALLGTVLFVVPALLSGGQERLAACGVILLVSAGYQISSPPDLATAACGLLALVVGAARRAPPPPPADRPTPAPSFEPSAPAPAA
jgi:hypothetical protein